MGTLTQRSKATLPWIESRNRALIMTLGSPAPLRLQARGQMRA